MYYIEKTCHDCVATQLSHGETTIGTGVNTYLTEYFERLTIKNMKDIKLNVIEISAELLESDGGRLAISNRC